MTTIPLNEALDILKPVSISGPIKSNELSSIIPGITRFKYFHLDLSSPRVAETIPPHIVVLKANLVSILFGDIFLAYALIFVAIK
jgi:hypothetical protein